MSTLRDLTRPDAGQSPNCWPQGPSGVENLAMTESRDDADRILIRSKWGTNRYVYDPHNPVGRVLIVGSLLFAVGGMYLLYHPGLLNGSNNWDEGELRSAVKAATAKLSSAAEFGPGTVTYEDILEDSIARHGNSSQDAVTVMLASEWPQSALVTGGEEQADYTVIADGTDTAFCLKVHAMKRKMAMGYDFVTIDIDEGKCPAS